MSKYFTPPIEESAAMLRSTRLTKASPPPPVFGTPGTGADVAVAVADGIEGAVGAAVTITTPDIPTPPGPP